MKKSPSKTNSTPRYTYLKVEIRSSVMVLSIQVLLAAKNLVKSLPAAVKLNGWGQYDSS